MSSKQTYEELELRVKELLGIDIAELKQTEEDLRKAHGELERKVEERTEELVMINEQLKEEIAERKRAEDALRKNEVRLSKINECFLNFLPDSLANINQLTSLCGKLFGATCSLYNRLDHGILYSWGQWNAPLDHNPVDKPDGHICYDVIKKGDEEVFVISDLQKTRYAQTDPNVVLYKLQTYVGKAVKFADSYVGSLCVVFRDNYVPSESDKKIMGIISSAIGVEEERRQAEEALRNSEERYRALADAAFEAVFISEKGICTDANQAATNMFGYTYDELIGIFGTDVIAQESKELVKSNILSGHEAPYEAVAQRKDGTTFHAEIRGKMTQYKGKSVRTTVVHDIDDRKRIEQTLRKAQDDLEMKVEERTAKLAISMNMLEKEIEERKLAELAIIEKRKDLENKTHELEEVNAALKVLLKHRDEDKKNFEEKIVANVKNLVFPYIEKLINSQLNDKQMVYLNIIKSNLEDIITPFIHQLSSKYYDLTPSEIQVAGLIKDGKTTKEIAELLNSSTGTVDFHRNNLRKKLGLINTKTNLRSFLLSLI